MIFKVSHSLENVKVQRGKVVYLRKPHHVVLDCHSICTILASRITFVCPPPPLPSRPLGQIQPNFYSASVSKAPN